MIAATPHRAARAFAAVSALVLALGVLSGCAFLPGLPGLPAPGGQSSGGQSSGDSDVEGSELVGTSWSGTDSDGDSWGLDFQSDGTVGLTYNGSSYDDPGDTWSQKGDTVSMHVGFDDGDVELVGHYEGLDEPMETDGSYDGGTFTLTLTRD